MNDGYQLRVKHRTPLLSKCLMIPGMVVFAACLIVCMMTWSAASQQEHLGMLRFMASGPIQIEVHDTEGNIVSRNVIEIEGATFHDENAEIVIEIPQSVVGNYLVHMNVNGSAIRLQHFDISVTNGVDTILLADNQLIVNAPHDPYVIRNSAEGMADVTDSAGSDGSETGSSTLIWILAGSAGVLAALGYFILRSRKRKR
jgi:LPXTG-motif cell wall-anchored protein